MDERELLCRFSVRNTGKLSLYPGRMQLTLELLDDDVQPIIRGVRNEIERLTIINRIAARKRKEKRA